MGRLVLASRLYLHRQLEHRLEPRSKMIIVVRLQFQFPIAAEAHHREMLFPPIALSVADRRSLANVNQRTSKCHLLSPLLLKNAGPVMAMIGRQHLVRCPPPHTSPPTRVWRPGISRG